MLQANFKLRSWVSSSAQDRQGRITEFCLSSGGWEGSESDHPPQPTSGSSGRRCSQAKQTSDIVPARPPITMQASPAKAISRLRPSPMPHGMTTVAGQSEAGISSGGMMLTTRPPASMACWAATLVAGLPQPLITVMPSRARSLPASPANSYAADPGSALPRMQTCGRRLEIVMRRPAGTSLWASSSDLWRSGTSLAQPSRGSAGI